MQPRKPTLAELDDLFNTPQQVKLERIDMGKHDYSISILRTEYENLEDRLDDLGYHIEAYGEKATELVRQKIHKKLSDISKAIDVLKEVE